MEEKKDVSLSTKIILAVMCFIPMFFMGYLTELSKKSSIFYK